MFFWRVDEPADAGRPGVIRAFTGRDGGAGTGPAGGFNLSRSVGDDPAAVEANRAALAASLGAAPPRLVSMAQVHGADVLVVGDGELPDPYGRADALVTRRTDVALVSTAADCVPVLFDDGAGLIGAAHAGREGMRAGVAAATVAVLRELGAGPLRATIGPSICAGCYEVPDELAEAAVADEPASRARSHTGTSAIDVAGGVEAQLRRVGVRVERVAGCTRETPTLHSHRRDAPGGRGAGVIRLLPATGGPR